MFERPGLAKDQLLVAGVGLKFAQAKCVYKCAMLRDWCQFEQDQSSFAGKQRSTPQGQLSCCCISPAGQAVNCDLTLTSLAYVDFCWLVLVRVNFLKVFAGIFFCNVHQRGAEGVPWWNSLILLARQLDGGNQTRSRHIMIYIIIMIYLCK